MAIDIVIDERSPMGRAPRQGEVFAQIAREANEAGVRAAEAHTPIPMVVTDRAAGRQYFVEGGVCGFAWVHFPGNTAWGRYAKANLGARKAYPGGLDMWVHEYGQSMERKEAYARAFAEVLRAYRIDAYAGSRMD